MKKKIQEYLKQYFSLNHNEKIIVGVSGGADSTALIDILISLNYNCIIAHCNFHLRDEESIRDEKFVKELANQKKCSFQKIDFQTKKYALKNGISIEMAARDLRYEWFEYLRQKENARFIAVAHHADDVVETVLMNLTRGTGINGLCGIKPINGYVIRPFLCVSRSEIMDYLEKNKLPFVLDSSNNDIDFVRNKFRNQIIPLLEEINPSFSKNLLETSDKLNDAAKIYNSFIKNIKKKIVTEENGNTYISIQKLKLEETRKSILFEILKEFGFNSSQTQIISKNIDSLSGKYYYSEKFRIVKDRKFLIVSEKTTNNDVFEIDEHCNITTNPTHLALERIKVTENFTIDKKPNFGYFDLSKVTFPLTIRHWQQGDVFHPLGMKNKKKLSDFFIDNKYSINKKEDTWLLVCNEDIIWVIGDRINEKYKVTSKTKFVLKISC